MVGTWPPMWTSLSQVMMVNHLMFLLVVRPAFWYQGILSSSDSHTERFAKFKTKQWVQVVYFNWGIAQRIFQFIAISGRKITSLGVLFDFTDNDKNTTVQKVADMVKEQWVRLTRITRVKWLYLFIGTSVRGCDSGWTWSIFACRVSVDHFGRGLLPMLVTFQTHASLSW